MDPRRDSPAPDVPPTKKRRSLAARAGLAAASLLVALLLGECAVRVLAPQPMHGSWRIRMPRGYAANRAGGTARHERPDGTAVEYRFNDDHLRGPPVADRGLRVLCVGDSFTFGWLLEEDATYVAHLQRAADTRFGAGTFQFLNGGAGGFGTSDAVAFVEDFGPRLKPDVVVLFMNPWDLGRSLEAGPLALADGETLALRDTAAPAGTPLTDTKTAPSPVYTWLLAHSHLVQFARRVVAGTTTPALAPPRVPDVAETPGAAPAPPPEPADAPDAVRLGRALFTRLDAWCRAHDCRLVVVATARPRADRPGVGTSHSTAVTDAFKRIAPGFFKELGVSWHDLVPSIVAAAAPRSGEYEIPVDGHPNEAGARLLADHIWPAIEGDLGRVTESRRR